MKTLRRLLALSILAAACAVAQAPAILADLTRDQLAGGLTSLGYQPQLAGDSLQFAAGGSTVIAGKSGTTLNLFAALTARMTLPAANEWNLNNPLAKIVISSDGSARLQSAIDLKGGVTPAALDTFVANFVRMLSAVSGAPSGMDASAAPSQPEPPIASTHKRNPNAKMEKKTSFGDFSIWVDTSKWKESPLKDEPTVLQFESRGGDAYAKILTEKAPIPKASLRQIAIDNIRKQDLNAKVILEEERMVNGRRVAVLQMDAVVNNLPIIYYGYYYGGTSGAIQIVCFTLKSSFAENLDRFTELLNGLEVRDQALPDPPLRSTVSELKLGSKLAVAYNSKKWKQTKESEPGRFSFTLGSGDGYALVIYEGLSVPLDNLPDIALTNAKAADPNAKVLSREKLTVNGLTIWRQKMSANVNGIPVYYFGHYYGGDGGTVQVLTYSGQSQFAGVEAELIEFLSGLHSVQ